MGVQLASAFEALPSDFKNVLQLAVETYDIDVIPLQELKGGRTSAILYLVSVSSFGSEQVEHLILKLDQTSGFTSDEIEKHSRALQEAPPEFVRDHMADLAFKRIEQGGAIAIFYRIAGESLHHYRSFADLEQPRQLEAVFQAINNDLLAEWNSAAAFEQAVHPQSLLVRWLAHRIKPGGSIERFLATVCQIDANTPGLLIEGQVFPNPFLFAREIAPWGSTRPIDALFGFQHGDLNITNILAKFTEDGRNLERYFIIDFALYMSQMPLTYDQRYLEMSYLLRCLSNVSLPKWVAFVTRFARNDILHPEKVSVELAGAATAIGSGRRAFDEWVKAHHMSLHDDLWGQFWLAAVAAGLNYCNKPTISDEERLAGLIFAAAHLKRFFTQFGVPLPVTVAHLYNASQSQGMSSDTHNIQVAGRSFQRLPILSSGFINEEAKLPDWIAQTKLQPPQPRQDLIPRRWLLESLHTAVSDSRLTLIVAPTGYGKTTLLTNLAHSLQNLSLAWLSIETEDNDPALFMRALIASLQRLNPAFGNLALSIQSRESSLAADGRRMAGVLINEIMDTLSESFLLAIDDLHWIKHPAIYEALESLIERMPPQMHLVIGTRHEPPLTLARLRARGELTDFRLADMRFTLDEAARLLNEQLRLGLSADDLDNLYNRTEGWPAGLRLFASSLQHLPPYGDRTALITQLARNNQYIVDLLAEEVFNRENPDNQMFLLQTSILPELSPALCKAVTGFDNSQVILNDLYRRNLFLQALGSNNSYLSSSDSTCCYRYHALFADYLQKRLAQTMPDQVPALHRRAGDAENVPSRAVTHYLAGQHWQEAAQLIEQIGEQLLQQGLLDSVYTWIHALPAEVRESRPKLAYLLGVHALHQHNIPHATTFLTRALQGFEANEQKLEQGQALAHLSTLAFLQADFNGGLAYVERGLQFPLPHHTRVHLLMERARIAQFQGDLVQSDKDVESALNVWLDTRDVNSLHILLDGFIPVFAAMDHGLDQLAQLCKAAEEQAFETNIMLQVAVKEQWQMIHLYQGDINSALLASEEALALGERLGGRPPWQHWTSQALALTAHVALGHRSQVDEIIDHLLEQNRLLQTPGDIHTRTMSGQLYYVAHACWLLERLDDTRRIYDQLRQIELPPNSPLTFTSTVTYILAKILDGTLKITQKNYPAAVRSLQEALSLQSNMPFFFLFGSTRVLLGHVYLKQGRYEEALAEIEQELVVAEKKGVLGSILMEAEIAVPLLQLVIEQGQHKSLAGHLLTTLGAGQRTDPDPVTIPDTGQTISSREIEVLKLIAAGASNQEIADTLILSLHTVKHHVAHILTKMNVSTRTQAAAKAHELGITR